MGDCVLDSNAMGLSVGGVLDSSQSDIFLGYETVAIAEK